MAVLRVADGFRYTLHDITEILYLWGPYTAARSPALALILASCTLAASPAEVFCKSLTGRRGVQTCRMYKGTV
jgi:hypothetical protein